MACWYWLMYTAPGIMLPSFLKSRKMKSLPSFYLLLSLYGLLFGVCWWVWQRKSDKLTSIAVLNGHWALLHIRHIAGILIMIGGPSLLLPELPLQLLKMPGHITPVQVMLLVLTALLNLLLASKAAEGSRTMMKGRRSPRPPASHAPYPASHRFSCIV